MSNITPIHRPPVGVWPPCPPVPCPPPDCIPGISSLERCYEEVKRAQAFLTQMIKDIIQCDPSILGTGTPIVGVTDGSDAQPGMVGEFFHTTAAVPYPATQQQVYANMGVLPAGDWDCWYWCSYTTDLASLGININPLPAGFSDQASIAVNLAGEAPDGIWMVSPTVRALTSQPSGLILQVSTNYLGGSTEAGTLNLTWASRRRR